MNYNSRIPKKLLFAGLTGNIIEWYDFALYGYFATKISEIFFPSDSTLKSTLITFTVFAVGLFMRPFGGIFFGYLGDKYGRTRALSLSIYLMSVPTFLIGLIPSYDQLGIISSILLVLCRLLQGIAVGGEFTCSMVYIIELSPINRKCFYSSMIMLSAFVGILLGSVVGALVDYYLTDTTISEYAWRLPFFASIILIYIGYYFRRNMPETNDFNELTNNGEDYQSISRLIKLVPRKFLFAILLVALPAGAFYVVFVYLVTYVEQVLNIDKTIILIINSCSLSILILFTPIFGYLADKIGNISLLVIGSISLLLLSYPLFNLLVTKDIYYIILSQFAFAILIALIYSVIPFTLSQLFSSSVRCTAVSFPYNIANSIFGGSAPFIATLLVYYLGNTGPSLYLIFIAILALVSIPNIISKRS